MTKRLTITEFWQIKHQIDDEIARLGWTKQQALSHIKNVYSRSSRLSMSDEQLKDLLQYLKSLNTPLANASIPKVVRRKKARRKRI